MNQPARRKGGLGRGLASLIPTGPSDGGHRLGDAAADVVIGGTAHGASAAPEGNGTAEIFTDDPTVFTMSMHGARNFPLRKYPSSLDVGLEDGTGDDEYLRALAAALAESFERARADIVLYIAGADPYEGDRLGRLGLTKAGLLERDRMVLAAATTAATPVAIVCGGGYCQDLEAIVDIHAATMLLAAGWPARRESRR